MSINKANAQMWSIGIYINGINLHLQKPLNPELYHRTLSKNKRLVYNIGGGVRISYYLNHFFSSKLNDADCIHYSLVLKIKKSIKL